MPPTGRTPRWDRGEQFDDGAKHGGQFCGQEILGQENRHADAEKPAINNAIRAL
jgi:hypothetical protein